MNKQKDCKLHLRYMNLKRRRIFDPSWVKGGRLGMLRMGEGENKA